jgi:tetratricopeptide (TPR) repeat protein
MSASRARAIFIELIAEVPPGQWEARLAELAGEDQELRGKVAALLAAHRKAGSFLEHPAAALGGTVDAPRPSEEPIATCDSKSGMPAEGAGVVLAGRYKLVETIGEGGMGAVWMAQQIEPVKRQVAVKLIKPGMDSKQVLARFEAERQALALMDHPSIARVFDAGATATGRPYFVMELVKGIPLTRYCDEQRLTPKQRLELFVPVCQAIQHAHQKGIIHRDIKPSNVLVASYDGKAVPKVIDFGIAKATGQQLTDHTMVTGLGTVVGTLEYMSPEQAERNQLDIDTRSDIYSLGVLLYELLTGTTPLDRKRLKEAAILELLRIIREEEPPRPSTRLSDARDALASISAQRQMEPGKLTKLMRGELDWIVMKALEKDRNRRYESANGFAMDVQRYLADEPVQACPPSAWYRLRKFARRNKGRLAVVAGLFLAVTVMAASIGWAVRDRESRAEESVRAEVARRAEVERQVRESWNAARTLLAENKVAAARQKLAEARAQLGNDRATLSELAAEVEAGATELDRWQQFLNLIDRAHEAETAPLLEAMLTADGRSQGSAGTRPPATSGGRQPAAAVPFLLQALAGYVVLERDDWNTTLTGGLLGKEQVEHLRQVAYEELLWLAKDVITRRQEHRTGRQLSQKDAARHALSYLGKAESAHRPTVAFYLLRAWCHQDLGEAAAAQADQQRADKTAPTLALDHHMRGLDAYDARQLAEGVQAFEAALRLDPTHYWSLIRLGYCWCDCGQRQEHFTVAAAVFYGCILKRPEHAHAYFCRGVAYDRLRQHDKAVADYSRAIELDPRDARAWNHRGIVYSANLGQPDKGVADFSKVIELNPEAAIGWVNRGSAYSYLGQPDRAVDDYSRAIQLARNFAMAWNGRGALYCDKLGRPDKAVDDFSQAIALDRKDANAWYGRGNAYRKLRQYARALDDYSQAIALDPNYEKAWNSRGAVYCDDLGQPDKAVADFSQAIGLNRRYAFAWGNRGRAYFQLRQYNKAVDDFSQAIELNPEDAFAWSNRGACYGNLRQYDKAIADLSKAVKIDPKNTAAHDQLERARKARQQQLDEAIAAARQAIEINPKDAKAQNALGQALKGKQQWEEASAAYRKAIELDPRAVVSYLGLGRAVLHLQEDDPKDEVAAARKAMELFPQMVAAHLALGERLLHTTPNPGKAVLEAAVAAYSKVIELEPGHNGGWCNRGVAYQRLGQWQKAHDDFSRAIQLVPTHLYALWGRAEVHGTTGQWAMAIADYDKAIEAAQRSPVWSKASLSNDLAWLLATCPEAKFRDPARAIELARKAIDLMPNESAHRYHTTLGLAYYRLGDAKAAITALSQSRAPDPVDWLLLAMSHAKLGAPEEARKWYGKAVQWIEKNSQTLEQEPRRAEVLRRFRSEAGDVMKRQ